MKEKRVIHGVFKSISNYFNLKKSSAFEIVRRILLFACVIIFVYSSYIIIEKWYDDYVAEQFLKNMIIEPVAPDNNNIFEPDGENDDLFLNLPNKNDKITSDQRSYVQTDIPGNMLASNGNIIGVEYLDYLNINKDVIGHIKIPDTQVDYPVLLHRLDNEFYLTRTIKLQLKAAASIFMDYRNRPYSEDQNTIVYGHNMKSGAMFRTLHQYKDSNFALKHTYIYYSTIYEDMVWEIFSSYTTDIEFNYIQTNFKTDKFYSDFLKKCKALSTVKYPAEPDINDRILTLSTCDARTTDRFVVQARLISRTKK